MAMVNINYTIRQGIPKIIEQKPSQMKLKCLSHTVYLLKIHRAKQGKRDGAVWVGEGQG